MLRESKPNGEKVPLPEAHPDADTLSAFWERVLPAAEQSSVFAHLADCEACRQCLAMLSELEDPELVAAGRKHRGFPAGSSLSTAGRCLKTAAVVAVVFLMAWFLQPTGSTPVASKFHPADAETNVASVSVLLNSHFAWPINSQLVAAPYRQVNLVSVSFEAGAASPRSAPLRPAANQIALQTTMGERWVTLDPLEKTVSR